MILLNFSHPFTPGQLAEVEKLTGQPVEQILALKTHFEQDQPFLPQLRLVLGQVPFTPEQWQTAPILVNPPSLNTITALLLAELHGRMGYFPPILRLRPVEGAFPPRFEAIEILNLQAVRDQARKERY
jgi:hypothetical protein